MISDKRDRDPASSLALSSRNAYLTPTEREYAAPMLYAALSASRSAWAAGLSKAECIERARGLVERKASALSPEGIDVKLDYIEMNDADSFEIVPEDERLATWEAGVPGRPVLLSGAMWVGKTRLIDNIILGDEASLGVLSS